METGTKIEVIEAGANTVWSTHDENPKEILLFLQSVESDIKMKFKLFTPASDTMQLIACNDCGAEIDMEDVFCRNCGSRQEK
ncbi:zinc-ribbon domain-containing protein [Acetobacterium sp.]|uniref:zinc-ribbon domain-containing protein n=1 Tax=Acetobacterium sp. TaxID=1872094 RepID=UPI002722E71C|nr:zinc-ribbon domain-containing protein [Acetobacterium sp.]MDO9492653.1 zinc-ribbon domain-containing protein [Acetobacterium sp.]